MAKFESTEKAQAVLRETQAVIMALIEDDLAEARCSDVNLDSWMDLFSKDKNMQEKFHELCGLEMALIDAQLFLEHEKV